MVPLPGMEELPDTGIALTCSRSGPLKAALTALSPSIVRVQPPVPEHAVPQPPKTLPAAGVAVSVTCAATVVQLHWGWDVSQEWPSEEMMAPAPATFALPVTPLAVTVMLCATPPM